MSMRLDQGTTPPGTEVKAGFSGDLRISPGGPGGVSMSPQDFAEVVVYMLVNTDLKPNDPRLALMERLRRIRIIEGFNGPGTGRLEVMGKPGEVPGGVIPGPWEKTHAPG